MAEKSVIIIGAGMAGLSAGVYARLNGYRAVIVEMHNLPGGMVTSWKRKDYLIDGCIEFLNGSNPLSRWNQLWRELGVAQDRQFVEHPELLRVRDPQGRELIFYADLDQLERHMLSLSPSDSGVIRELTGAARAMAAFDPPLDARPLAMLGELPRMSRWLDTFNRYNRVTLAGFCERFKDPFLRKAFLHVARPDTPMGAVLGMLAFQSARNMGYPLGGSLALAGAVEQRFQDLGGEVIYRSRVDQILVEPGARGRTDRVTGVHLEDGRILEADWVISAADGRTTVYELLNSQYLDDAIRERYHSLPLTPPVTQVALGVRFDMTAEPHAQIDLFGQPLYLAGQEQPYLWYQHFAFDQSIAPPGRTVILARLRSDYDFWLAQGYGSSRYEVAKEEVARALIDHLEQRYPVIRRRIEMIDVATPLTYERYTGSYRGTAQSYALTPQTIQFTANGMDPSLPGLAGFYQIGQWVYPGGGVFPAARSGREIVRRMCKQDGKRFTGGKYG